MLLYANYGKHIYDKWENSFTTQKTSHFTQNIFLDQKY